MIDESELLKNNAFYEPKTISIKPLIDGDEVEEKEEEKIEDSEIQLNPSLLMQNKFA